MSVLFFFRNILRVFVICSLLWTVLTIAWMSTSLQTLNWFMIFRRTTPTMTMMMTTIRNIEVAWDWCRTIRFVRNQNFWSYRLSFCRIRWWESEVKNRTETQSNRRPKMAKNLGWRGRSQCYVTTGARRRGCGMILHLTGYNRLLRQVAFELIPADHEHLKTLVWSCMTASWHYWRQKRSHVPLAFFAVCLTVFPFEFRPQTFTIGLQGKNHSAQKLSRENIHQLIINFLTWERLMV